MSGRELARRVELTGWSTVLLGLVCLALGLLQVALPALLARLDTALSGVDDPTSARVRQAFGRGDPWSAAVNLAFGAALVVIGVAVARRAAWSHRALTVAAWASIAALAAMAKPSIAPLLAVAGAGEGTGPVVLAIGLLLLVAQIAAVLWFLRFWRRSEVRALFGPEA